MTYAGWQPIVFIIAVLSFAAAPIAWAQSVKTSGEDAIFKTKEDLSDAEAVLAAVDKATGCPDLQALLDRTQKIFNALKADYDLLDKLYDPSDADFDGPGGIMQEFQGQLGEKIENYLGVKGATVYDYGMFQKMKEGMNEIERKIEECNKSGKSQAKTPDGGTGISGPTTPIGGSGATSSAVQSNIPGLLKGPTTPIGGSGAASSAVQSGVPSMHKGPTTPIGGSGATSSAVQGSLPAMQKGPTTPIGGVQNLKSQTSTTAKGAVTNTNIGTPLVSGSGASASKGKTVTKTKVGTTSSGKSGTTINTTIGAPIIRMPGLGGGF